MCVCATARSRSGGATATSHRAQRPSQNDAAPSVRYALNSGVTNTATYPAVAGQATCGRPAPWVADSGCQMRTDEPCAASDIAARRTSNLQFFLQSVLQSAFWWSAPRHDVTAIARHKCADYTGLTVQHFRRLLCRCALFVRLRAAHLVCACVERRFRRWLQACAISHVTSGI